MKIGSSCTLPYFVVIIFLLILCLYLLLYLCSMLSVNVGRDTARTDSGYVQLYLAGQVDSDADSEVQIYGLAHDDLQQCSAPVCELRRRAPGF